MFHFNKKNQSPIKIIMTRDSVSMGDDCMAPHKQEITFESSDTLEDLLIQASQYVPAMYDFEWKVMCEAKVIGRLISNQKAEYQIQLEGPNKKISSLPVKKVFCRKCNKEPLSYFEKVEILYNGEYFNPTLFKEYGDFKTILEKGATKITTCNKEFALKHDFILRELQWYDKIIKIEEFDGMRIVRIPNHLEVDVEYILISKDKVLEELNQRAKN